MTARPAAAVLALALAGATAQAAQPGGGWTVTEADPTAAPAGPVALALDGRVLSAGAECGDSACATVLATRPPGGAFERADRVPGAPAAFTPLRDGAALVVTAPLSHRGLTAVDATPAGRVARTSRLERRFARAAVAASNRNGTTAAAWLTSAAPQRLRVRVRGRDRGAFGAARTIATFARGGDFGGDALAVGPRGEVAVLWVSRGALRARLRRPGGHRFGPALRAGRSDRLAQVSASFTAGGTLVAIWSSADAGEEQNRAAVVRVASLRRGAERFTLARRLGEGADRETLARSSGTAVRAVAAGRTANIAWSSRSLQVRLGTVHADGAVSAVRVVEARGVLADAAGSTTGRALIAWTHDPLGPDSGAWALPRVSAQMLGPRQAVGPAGGRATGAALDDTASRAVVTWAAGDPALTPRWGIAERAAP